MSPWLAILILIIVLFVLITAIRGLRDLYIWYCEGRDFAREQKKAKQLRQQRRSEKLKMPALKERPADAPKPPERPK